MSKSVDEQYREVLAQLAGLQKILQDRQRMIRQLQEQLERLEKKYRRCEKARQDLQHQYDRLAAKLVILQTKGSKPRTHQQLLKKKLQAYIATIDRCLEILKNRQG